MRLYSEDNPLFEVLNKVGDLMMINLIFIFTCLPIVTIGAASTAMYTTVYKMIKQENKQVLKEYLETFRLNFKQSTIIGMILTVIIGIALIDLEILVSFQNSWMIGLIYVVLFFVVVVISYIFPLTALFHNKVSTFFKNAIVIAILNTPTTLLVVLLNMAPIIALWIGDIILQGAVFVYLLCGFSTTSYIIMRKLIKVFEKYSQEIKIS